jgi:hypothetical protein
MVSIWGGLGRRRAGPEQAAEPKKMAFSWLRGKILHATIAKVLIRLGAAGLSFPVQLKAGAEFRRVV